MPQFYTVQDAAPLLHLSPRAVQHRIARNQIQAEKAGTGRTSAYLIPAAEIERLLLAS